VISLVVFSKDRAMQLDSLLRSVCDNCTGIKHVAVIAKASSQLHIDAYKLLRETETYDELTVAGPDGGLPLGHDLAALADDYADGVPTDHIALAVDDQLFYAPSDFRKAAFSLDEHKAFVWSWRLGLRKDRSETERCPCPLDEADPHWLCSAFENDPDYGYLFHSDGALYRTSAYVNKLDTWLPDWRTGNYTPNDLEAAVTARAARWKPSVGPHVGPLSPTSITWQLNRVQTKYGSPAAEIPETNVDALARAYLEGKRVDNEKLYEALRADPLQWNPPGARPTHVYACEEASKFWAGCVR